MTIEIIICTRHNQEKLQTTLAHLLPLLESSMSVLVVDQSQVPLSSTKRLTVLHRPHQRGLSKARNEAIRYSQADILAWLDDDCIVTQSYIQQLHRLARQMTSVKVQALAGVCGRTEPYAPTRPGPEYECPSVFSKSNQRPVAVPQTHWKHIGLGNNMVLFRPVFAQVGIFEEKLGVGAIGESGEDAEFMLRCLNRGYTFLYDKNLLLYHNKWLTRSEMNRQNQMYNCGGIAVYGFFFLRGIKVGGNEFYLAVHNTFFLAVRSLQQGKLATSLSHLYRLAKGLGLAVYLALEDLITGQKLRPAHDRSQSG